jgi:outer membrane immunogenic protein
MKKSILILTLIMTATLYVSAQDKNVGVGLAYGTEIEKPAIFVNGQYFINDKLAITPSFIFYFPRKEEVSGSGYTSKSTSTFWELNADVNYYFLDESVKLYAIGGLNITGSKYKYEANYPSFPSLNSNTSVSGTEVGLNLGIGIDFKTSGKMVPFLQTKYTLGDFDQLVLMGGLRFGLGN